MDFKLIEDFLSLARTKSFSKSAQERHITQSGFSRRIKALENWLGTSLVDRSTYPTTLTKDGVFFFETAWETLHSIYQLREDFQNRRKEEEYILAVSAVHTLALTFFPRWLKNTELSLGPISTRLAADNMHDCVDALVRGDSDFLFCYWHPNEIFDIDPERFEYVEIGSEQLIPVSIPDERGKPKFHLPGNRKSPIPHLVYASDAFLGKLVGHLLEMSSVPCFLKTYYENSLAEALKTAAIEGLGLAWLPESAIRTELDTNKLVRSGDPRWDIDLTVRVYRSRSSEKPKAAEVWKTFLADKPAT
ncbi:MAG: LysR family transcriptional regulator [Rhodospirillales bacterium]|nr:LysR family transcriptional regulator [Rhodospirillales bacterium]